MSATTSPTWAYLAPTIEGASEPMSQSIQIVLIGTINNGCDGSDQYVLLKSREDILTPDRAREYLLPLVYRECTRPGGYFCTTVTVQQVENNDNEVIAVIQHRFDV